MRVLRDLPSQLTVDPVDIPQRWLKALLAASLMSVPVGRLPIRLGAVLGVILLFGHLNSGSNKLKSLALAALLAVWGGAILAIFGGLQGARDYGLGQALLIASSVIGFVGVISLFVWCARITSPYMMLGIFCLTIIAVPLVKPELWAANPWKFGLSWPVTVLALCVAQRRGSHWTAAVLVSSAFISAVQDMRGMLVFCCAALLTLMVSGTTVRPTARTIIKKLIFLLAVFWMISIAGGALASSGILGVAIQEKTQWQDSKSGNLVFSVRTEIPTSIELLKTRPWGYGLGVLPDSDDRSRSRQAMADVGANPDDALLDNEGATTFRLHSELADLWFFFGLAAFPLLWLIAKHIVSGLIAPPPGLTAQQHALLAFQLTFAAWDFFFSPFDNNYTLSALSIGMLIALHERHSNASTPELSADRRVSL